MFCRLALCGGNFTISPFFSHQACFGCGKVTPKKKANCGKTPCKSCCDEWIISVPETPAHSLSCGSGLICKDSKCPPGTIPCSISHRPSLTTTKHHRNRAGYIQELAYQIHVLCSQWHFHWSNAAHSQPEVYLTLLNFDPRYTGASTKLDVRDLFDSSSGSLYREQRRNSSLVRSTSFKKQQLEVG